MRHIAADCALFYLIRPQLEVECPRDGEIAELEEHDPDHQKDEDDVHAGDQVRVDDVVTVGFLTRGRVHQAAIGLRSREKSTGYEFAAEIMNGSFRDFNYEPVEKESINREKVKVWKQGRCQIVIRAFKHAPFTWNAR